MELDPIEKLSREHGITFKKSPMIGRDTMTQCPKCHHSRKHRNKLSLSVLIKNDGSATWNCKNKPECSFVGGFGNGSGKQYKKRAFKPEPIRYIEKPVSVKRSENFAKWMKSRGIEQETVENFGLYEDIRNRLVDTGKVDKEGKAVTKWEKQPVIISPYFHNGKVTNLKGRFYMDKGFTQSKGAVQIPYNMDGLMNAWDTADDIAETVGRKRQVIFVEGEVDVWTLWQHGYKNTICLPNGADGIEALKNVEWLEKIEEVIIAVDDDPAGQRTGEQLINRFGKDICKLVKWGRNVYEGKRFKDANDFLQNGLVSEMKSILDNPHPVPVEGVRDPLLDWDDLYDRFRGLEPPIKMTGIPGLDDIYKVKEGTLHIFTGRPQDGKSNFMDQIAVGMSRRYGWKFLFYSPENDFIDHRESLVEKTAERKLVGDYDPMSEDEFAKSMEFTVNHMYFMDLSMIEGTGADPTIDNIIQKIVQMNKRYGLDGVVIDPYNMVSRSGGGTEVEHILQFLQKLQTILCKRHGITVWVVAHTTKLGEKTFEDITLEDVSGSKVWESAADMGLAIHWDRKDGSRNKGRVTIRTLKVRSQPRWGRNGKAYFRFDPHCGSYVPWDGETIETSSEPAENEPESCNTVITFPSPTRPDSA